MGRVYEYGGQGIGVDKDHNRRPLYNVNSFFMLIQKPLWENELFGDGLIFPDIPTWQPLLPRRICLYSVDRCS